MGVERSLLTDHTGLLHEDITQAHSSRSCENACWFPRDYKRC